MTVRAQTLNTGGQTTLETLLKDLTTAILVLEVLAALGKQVGARMWRLRLRLRLRLWVWVWLRLWVWVWVWVWVWFGLRVGFRPRVWIRVWIRV